MKVLFVFFSLIHIALAGLNVSKDNKTLVSIANNLSSYTSSGLSSADAETLAIVVKSTVVTPSAVTFAPADVTTGTDLITKAAHGLITGLKGQFTTVTTLPAGLSLATDYFIVVISSSTFKVSDTYAHALAGTNIIDITDQGTDNHTFTPTALAGGNVKIQAALEDVDASYLDLTDANMGDASQAITASGYLFFVKNNPEFPYYRLVFAQTAGALDILATYTFKARKN